MEEVLSFAFPADKYPLGSSVASSTAAVLSPEEKLASVVAKAVAEALKS
jgi:hypothetical protein